MYARTCIIPSLLVVLLGIVRLHAGSMYQTMLGVGRLCTALGNMSTLSTNSGAEYCL